MEGIKDLFNILWNFYFKNEGNINYSGIGITIGILSFITPILWYYIQSRRILKIQTSYRAQIPDFGGGILGKVVPLFSVYITNKSRRTIHIDQITIIINKKINNNDEFHYLNSSNPTSFPIKLEASGRYVYDYDMNSLNSNIFMKSPNIKSFKIIVRDTFNKKYISKKILLKKYVEHMNSILKTNQA